MHPQVRVRERMLRTHSGRKYRLQIGDREFQAAAFEVAGGGRQLSLLPAESSSHPVVRIQVGELPSNDVELTSEDLEAMLLAVASSMSDRLSGDR